MAMFYILLLFMIIAALIAVETKNLLYAVICVGAVGVGGSLMFLFLRAPEIAMTQVVVEIFGLIILIRATISRDLTFITGDREFFGLVVTLIALFVIFLAGTKALETLPNFGTPAFTRQTQSASQTYISKGLEETGASNLVSAVVLGFRAYDALGEATILFTTILGVTIILRKKSRKLIGEADE